MNKRLKILEEGLDNLNATHNSFIDTKEQKKEFEKKIEKPREEIIYKEDPKYIVDN
jgi:hypothetical protein